MAGGRREGSSKSMSDGSTILAVPVSASRNLERSSVKWNIADPNSHSGNASETRLRDSGEENTASSSHPRATASRMALAEGCPTMEIPTSSGSRTTNPPSPAPKTSHSPERRSDRGSTQHGMSGKATAIRVKVFLSGCAISRHLRRLDGVVKEHRPRHRADPARNRSYV